MIKTTVRCQDCGRQYCFYFMPCCPGCGSEEYELIRTEEEAGCEDEETSLEREFVV